MALWDFEPEIMDHVDDDDFRDVVHSHQIAWLVGGPFVIITVALIMVYEFRNRKKITAEQVRLQKPLLRWSLFVMVSSLLSGLLYMLFKMPDSFPVCDYFAHLALFVWFNKNIFLGLFQLNRLRLILNNDNNGMFQVKSWVFPAFTISAGIMFLLWICTLFTIKLINVGPYGCHIGFSVWSWVAWGIIGTVYMVWDWSMLFIYVYKLRQLRALMRSKEDTNESGKQLSDDMEMYQEIQNALSKILLLTFVNESTVGICSVLAFILEFTGSHIVVILHSTFVVIDTVMTSYVVFLMQSHNKQQYRLFMRIFIALRCNICCKKFISDAQGETTPKKKGMTVVISQTDLNLSSQQSSSNKGSSNAEQPDLE